MKFLGAIEVDQIQKMIFETDKLKEMIGASRLVEDTITHVKNELDKDEYNKAVELFWPVSGVFKMISGDKDKLAECLWNIKNDFYSKMGLSSIACMVSFDDSGDDFGEAWQNLEKNMRVQKDSKQGENGLPSLPYFAQCRLIPGRFANYWYPSYKNDEQKKRRALLSREANFRKPLEKGLPCIEEIIDEFNMRHPNDLDDLTIRNASDSYVAFIKADGDGLGKILSGLNWETISWEHAPSESHKKAFEFSKQLQTVFLKSLKEAIKMVVQPESKAVMPIAPILMGGEDMWLLCRRDKAFPLIKNIGEIFSQKAANHPIIQNALNTLKNPDALTLSFGVLFAQKGYPFYNQADLVKELLRLSKAYRKTLAVKQGCVDFHWLEASSRDSIEFYRKNGYRYKDKDNSKTFVLYSRPWTIEELGDVLEAVTELKIISSRKMHQLRQILRSGDVLSVAMMHHWWTQLEEVEQQAWNTCVSKLPDRIKPGTLLLNKSLKDFQGFWNNSNVQKNVMISCIIDMIEMLKILDNPNK